MLFQVRLASFECKSLVSVLLEVVLEIAGVNSVGWPGVEYSLDLRCVRICVKRSALLALPELHHHRNTGSTAAILFLLDKGNVQPYTRLAGCAHQCAYTQRRQNIAPDNPAQSTLELPVSAQQR